MPTPLLEPHQLERLDAWLRLVLWEGLVPARSGQSRAHDATIYRLKGRQPFSDGSLKMIQGVREVFEISDAPQAEGPQDGGKMVLIGKKLRGLDWQANLADFMHGE
jgi:hypothetical protein